MSEKLAYRHFKKAFNNLDRINRVENHDCCVGMPDVNICTKDLGEMWIEIKSPKEPKRETTPLFGSNHKISPDQKKWFKKQIDAGGSGVYLIYTDKRVIIIDAIHSENINSMTLNDIISNSLFAAKKPIRDKKVWADMRNALKHAQNIQRPSPICISEST